MFSTHAPRTFPGAAAEKFNHRASRPRKRVSSTTKSLGESAMLASVRWDRWASTRLAGKSRVNVTVQPAGLRGALLHHTRQHCVSGAVRIVTYTMIEKASLNILTGHIKPVRRIFCLLLVLFRSAFIASLMHEQCSLNSSNCTAQLFDNHGNDKDESNLFLRILRNIYALGLKVFTVDTFGSSYWA